MPECLYVLTGGQPHVVAELEKRFKQEGTTNVLLSGMLPDPEEPRFYQQAADVLVSYYSTQDHPYAHNQLPAKLAEYMATGNPIVAADFPAVRGLLNSGNSLLVEPHNLEALIEALLFAVENGDEVAALGLAAQRDIASHTSEAVAAQLGRFLTALVDG
jgi:glycosyltransferase involved in cell wall biosynthesis